jgi:ribosomal protein L12E/L44/L45/RPP1/RPP2
MAKNAWQLHVSETMKKNPGKSLKECLQMAKKTYKKTATASVTKKAKKSKAAKKSRKARKGTKKARKVKKSKKSRK